MSGAVARRSFLKLMTAAPAGLKHLAERITKVEATGTMASVGMFHTAVPPSITGPAYLLDDPRVLALVKSGMPDWLRDDIHTTIIDNNRHRGFNADIAALRSVSLSAKQHIQQRRLVKKGWDKMLEQHAMKSVRNMFYGNQAPPPGQALADIVQGYQG